MKYAGVLAIAAACLAAGYWLGQANLPSTAHDAAAEQTPTRAVEPFAPAADPAAPVNRPGPTAISLAELAQLPSEFDQTLALYRLIEPLDTKALLELINQADRELYGHDLAAATAIMFGRLAELNPGFALQEVLNRPSTAKAQRLSAIFHTWSRQDLAAALGAAENLPINLRQTATLAIVRARDDLALGERREIAAAANMTLPLTVASTDFNEAWRLALEEEKTGLRMQNLTSIASQWAQSDPRAAIQAVAELADRNLYNRVHAHIIHQWASQDAQQALDYLMAQPASPQRKNELTIVFAQLARQDPADALARAESLPPALQQAALNSIIYPWAQQDPQAVSDWMLSQDNRELSFMAAYAVAQNMINSDIDAAMIWLDELPEGYAKAVTPTLVASLANNDPQRAADWIQQLDDAQTRAQAERTLASNWARSDPQAAAGWVAEQAPEQRPGLYSQLTPNWYQFDPDAAVEFARGLENSTERDQALLNLLWLAQRDGRYPNLIDEISDPELRRQFDESQSTLSSSTATGFAPAIRNRTIGVINRQ